MRLTCLLVLLIGFIPIATHAQNELSPSLNIGDSAPPLRVRGWLKGTPVQKFEKGKVYVLEFWATWCAPCKAAMPRLSALAREYKDNVTILGIDVFETKTTSMEKLQAFVDSMANQMDYHVASEDSNFMVSGWMEASAEGGIPKTFVVNAEGRLAWIGHPKDLDKVLRRILNNAWDIKAALAKRISDRHLAKLDEEASFELYPYLGDPRKADDLGKPDSVLFMINEMVKKEPELRYAPRIAYYTFSSLLKMNPHRAFEYGKVAMVTSSYETPPLETIIGVINSYSGSLSIPVEIYQLGAEAYQAQIDQIPYPELVNISNLYSNMAEWYWRANNKLKAIDAQQKAITALKSKHETEMDAFESLLQQYKNQ